MKVFRILLVLLIIGTSTKVTFAKFSTLSVQELKRYKPLKAHEGKSLPSLTTAKLSNLNLAKPVKYFDIRGYDTWGKYTGGWSFDMLAFKKLSRKEQKKLNSIKITKKNYAIAYTYLQDSTLVDSYYLHYIDMNSILYTISSRKELLAFLGTIDTPVELHIALLGSYGSIRYKQIENIYILRYESSTYEDYDGGDYEYAHSINHIIMDNRANKLLSKELVYEGCRGKKCVDLRGK